MHKPLLRALRGEKLETPPVWLMRQAGRYLPEYRALRAKAPDFLSFCFTPALAAAATMQPVHRFGLDGAIIFSDILVVPYALGWGVGFREGEGPVLDRLSERRQAEALDPDAVLSRVAPVMETVQRVKASLPADVALIGFAGSPWTVATYMVEGGPSRDFAAVKRWAATADLGFAVLIDRLVEATIAYLDAQIRAGAEAVQLFDSWAGVLPEKEFARWVMPPTARIAMALRASHPTVPVIGFPRGAGALYERYAKESQVDALSLDADVPLAWARAKLQRRMPVQGNLDPALLVAGGMPMLNAIAAIKRALGRGPFVFNLGHGIRPETPPQNVTALVAAVRDAGIGS